MATLSKKDIQELLPKVKANTFTRSVIRLSCCTCQQRIKPGLIRTHLPKTGCYSTQFKCLSCSQVMSKEDATRHHKCVSNMLKYPQIRKMVDTFMAQNKEPKPLKEPQNALEYVLRQRKEQKQNYKRWLSTLPRKERGTLRELPRLPDFNILYAKYKKKYTDDEGKEIIEEGRAAEPKNYHNQPYQYNKHETKDERKSRQKGELAEDFLSFGAPSNRRKIQNTQQAKEDQGEEEFVPFDQGDDQEAEEGSGEDYDNNFTTFDQDEEEEEYNQQSEKRPQLKRFGRSGDDDNAPQQKRLKSSHHDQ